MQAIRVVVAPMRRVSRLFTMRTRSWRCSVPDVISLFFGPPAPASQYSISSLSWSSHSRYRFSAISSLTIISGENPRRPAPLRQRQQTYRHNAPFSYLALPSASSLNSKVHSRAKIPGSHKQFSIHLSTGSDSSYKWYSCQIHLPPPGSCSSDWKARMPHSCCSAQTSSVKCRSPVQNLSRRRNLRVSRLRVMVWMPKRTAIWSVRRASIWNVGVTRMNWRWSVPAGAPSWLNQKRDGSRWTKSPWLILNVPHGVGLPNPDN